ncbi:HNH endonuclease signature motif containing protein [Streptomyces sp. TX20-6-3]|uniref:HNH endonuclease signature motif containing protein n=1 Tax=Streptomyces sp. TX20-6-3 TaxID=3028705 RepID=UPI0029A258B2|nr:HNH endonuclease signature motif containing protein [Streptomyces sp. TX20-6-3]MDX2564163.1 HNH endonuclease signature motif containing protein [Streptomyces sp. TX20-6-3]
MTAWLVLAVGDERQHGGNDGYDDNPRTHYSWDSTVPNHGKIAVGDVIALWDKKELIGVSVIHAIDTAVEQKTVYFCPECRKADFKRRTRLTPACRCNKCGALFDEPGSKVKTVTTYRSRHGRTWIDGRGLLTGRQLRALCDSPDSQLSMRSARWEKLRDALLATEGADQVSTLAGRERLPIPGGHRTVQTKARIGQPQFRERLLQEQGELCAITGPAPACVLEAAHLYSYADSGEHHDFGGLLLRRDIHRLFDLGHLAIDPATGLLDAADSLDAYPDYVRLHGQKPAYELQVGHRVWLAEHWYSHRSASIPAPRAVADSEAVNSARS